MLWLTLAITVILTLGWLGTGVLLLRMLQQERNTFQKERESLLNRLMTKTWQDYAQVQMTSQTTSISVSDEAVGMSDEEELRRIASWYNETVGTGEVLVDIEDDMRELGIETQ